VTKTLKWVSLCSDNKGNNKASGLDEIVYTRVVNSMNEKTHTKEVKKGSSRCVKARMPNDNWWMVTTGGEVKIVTVKPGNVSPVIISIKEDDYHGNAN
jgi:hypothetical protein